MGKDRRVAADFVMTPLYVKGRMQWAAKHLCRRVPKSYDAPGRLDHVSLEEAVMAKTTCPISRSEFRTGAKAITIKIGEVPMQAEPREFSTGSLGWYLNGKTSIEVGGKMVSVQIGMNLTIVGSKELPKES
jgi:hypothetical protein